LENRKVVDQKLSKVLGLLEAQPALFTKQGSVVETWRVYRGQKLGPYYRLAFRDGGRQSSIYLGTCKERANQIRAVLVSLQNSTILKNTVKRARAQVCSQLRQHKKDWEKLLQKHGLHLQGFEVRGWTKADVLSAGDRESTN